MVVTKEIAKLRINVENSVFSTEDIYKAVREKGEALRFGVTETEQEMKPSKYGHERKFVFSLDKDYDNFARAEIEVKMEFFNLNKVKQGGRELEKGDASIVIKAKLTLDYTNEWGKKKLHRWLFSLYQSLYRDKMKKKYIKPLDIDAEKMHAVIKDLLDKYH